MKIRDILGRGLSLFKRDKAYSVSFPWPGAPMNWWQLNVDSRTADAERAGPVHACVKIISEDMARIPLSHKQTTETGDVVTVTNRAPARVFRKPNSYQTRTDFILYIMRSLLLDGNAYIYPVRNNRYEIDQLYPLSPDSCWPYVVPETGEVLYRVGSSAWSTLAGMDPTELENTSWVPARDILHIRLHTPRHPLVGESPLLAAMYPVVTGMEINKHIADFFHNMGRPSGILRHPGSLSEEAMVRIKEKFRELFSGGRTGDVAVLREGMEWTSLTMSAVDAELVQSYQLTERQIAQVFRMPPFLLGDLQKTTMSNVESLFRYYLQSCLGFYIDHIEEAFTQFFGLPVNEHIQFDIEQALLRGDLEQRMNAYAKGIQNGVYAPNEARAREGLPPVEFGDEPRVQQQLVPLQYGMLVQPPNPGATAPPAEPEKPEPEEPEEEEEEKDADFLYYQLKAEMGRCAYHG